MTESPPQLPASAPNNPPPRSRGSFGFGGLFRLVFLSLVGGVGIVGGVALAGFFPDRNPQAPFLETALQNFRLSGETRVAAPVITNSNNYPEVLPVSPVDTASATPSPSPSSTITPTNTPTSSPTNPEAAQIQQDLQQVRQQLKEIGDRTASLEQKLGVADTKGSLETRVEKLSQQLKTLATPAPTPLDTPKTASPSPTTTASPAQTIISSPSANTPSVAVSISSPSFSLPITSGGTTQKKITLPTDPLFDSNSNILRPESILLLSQVANELRGIVGTTVQVTVHNNLSGEPSNDRRLSFQQAKAIREYLATQLGDRFRFVAIGYGSTRPLVAITDRPENRRIEIIVE